MFHCHVSSGWTLIMRTQIVDFSEWASCQSDKVFQISLGDKNESLVLTEEVIY